MKTRILLAIVLASCLTSCAGYQRAITQPAINRIQPGVTTEAEVVKMFGPPDTKVVDQLGRASLAWFRSLGPKPGGYLPLVGQFAGGLDLEVQQLWVVFGSSGRVSSYTVYDSKGAVKTEKAYRDIYPGDGFSK